MAYIHITLQRLEGMRSISADHRSEIIANKRIIAVKQRQIMYIFCGAFYKLYEHPKMRRSNTSKVIQLISCT